MAGVATFVEQLERLGYTAELRPGDIVAFDYSVEVGPLAGDTVKIAVKPAPDFPMSPPSGPIVSPRILPLNPDGGPQHPRGAVHAAETGGLHDPDGRWEYWSRPVPNWPSTSRDVRAYLCHIRTLFSTLPDDLQRSTDD